MKLEKLTQQQILKLDENKEKFISKFLNSDKIDIDLSKEVIKFVYGLINKPMPDIYIASNPFEAQQIANDLMKTKNKYYSTGTYLSIYWASFYAWAETYVDFGILTKENVPDYFKLRKFIETNIFSTIEFDTAIILVEKPKIILKNINGMHNISGPSIQWEDNYGLYFINGREIPETHYNSILNKSFKMQDFINEPNEEIKSTCIALMQEKFGDEHLVQFFKEHLTEIDTFVDTKSDDYLEGTTKGMNVGVYTLFKGKINGEKIAYVRCYCPSTDRMFFLGVNDSFKNVKDAIASLYRIPSKLKSHIKSISRQGERFSTILTDKGNEILENMSQSEIENVSGLDGESYFKLMQYEY